MATTRKTIIRYTLTHRNSAGSWHLYLCEETEQLLQTKLWLGETQILHFDGYKALLKHNEIQEAKTMDGRELILSHWLQGSGWYPGK